MSFSSEIKKELCETEVYDRELLKAELYGMLLFANTFSESKIVFKTENIYACKRIIFLLQNLFMPIIEKQTALRTKSSDSHLYKVVVVDSDECKQIFEDFGHSKNQVTMRVNRANVSSEEFSSAFIRGAFLSCGSVSDPMKGYHAEFCVPYKNLSLDLCKILSEITECEFSPKTIVRNGNYVVYFKGSEQICEIGRAHV